METLDRENEFAKLNVVDGFLLTGAKKKFLQFGYNYSYYGPYGFWSIEKVKLRVSLSEIKKMRIINFGLIIAMLFFVFAAMSFGFGLIRFKDELTGEYTSPSHVAIGTIIALILAGLGVLYLRTKMGRLRILQTSVGGNLPMLLYASLDVSELKTIRELIKQYQSGNFQPAPSHQPPPLPAK